MRARDSSSGPVMLASAAHRCGHCSKVSPASSTGVPMQFCRLTTLVLASSVVAGGGGITLLQRLWIVDCPHACPRVADEQLDAPLQHWHVVESGKVHNLTDSLGREVAVSYDPAAQLMERGHTLCTLLRRAGTRSAIGYKIARIARFEAAWRTDHPSLGAGVT